MRGIARAIPNEQTVLVNEHKSGGLMLWQFTAIP